jgi:uncharacterized membrane protein YvbJ
MALINCSECGKMISDKAKNCPECGCPINSNDKTDVDIQVQNSAPTVIVKPKEGCFLQTLNFGCIVIVIIIVIIVIAIVANF